MELIVLILEILLLIFTSKNRAHFSRWAVTEPIAIFQAKTSLLISEFEWYRDRLNRYIHVAEESSKIIVVNSNRVVYELDLSRLTFKDDNLAPPESEISPHSPHCQKFYRISSNGCHLVGVYIRCPECSDSTTSDHEDEHSKSLELGETRMELRIVDLSVKTDQMQRMELIYSEPNLSAAHNHVVTFSPDLSMMQAGPHIFDLLTPSHPPLTFPKFPLNVLRQNKDSHISFSSCNSYLIVVEGKDAAANGEPAKFKLFRICRTAGTVEEIATNVLDNLVANRIAAAFHPILPLLVLTYITYPETDTYDNARYITVMETDLQELKPVPIALPKFRPFIYDL